MSSMLSILQRLSLVKKKENKMTGNGFKGTYLLPPCFVHAGKAMGLDTATAIWLFESLWPCIISAE